MERLKEASNITEFIRQLKNKDIEESAFPQYVDNFIESKARKCKIPLTGTFELTPLCNLNCKMCYVHLNGSQFRESQLISVEIWKSLMKKAHELGMMRATLTGGECFTYYGFDEIYIYLYNMGIRPTILTNGILAHEKANSLFAQYPPRRIQVSLYGSSEDAYEKITGSRVFHRVLDNILLLKEKNYPVRIAITPSQYMIDDLNALLNVAERLGVPYGLNSGLIPPRENTGRKINDLTPQQYLDLYRIKNKNKLYECIDPTDLPDENHEGAAKFGLNCGGGKSAFCINSDGSMSPCPSLNEVKTYPLISGFSTAWKELNAAVDKYMTPKECNGCIYYTRCIHCVARHKNASKPGHCDTRICERTKKLIAAGCLPPPKDIRLK